jgi:hypothetical protein
VARPGWCCWSSWGNAPYVRCGGGSAAGRTAPSAAPALSLRSGRGNRTPRTVQALAAAGTAPTEIAWKTGLPLDAVSMLLEINGGTLARQL